MTALTLKHDLSHLKPEYEANSIVLNQTRIQHVLEVIIDLRDLLGGTAHEEEWHTEKGGGGQHHHREPWDGLQRETGPLHDDATSQHPHRYSRQIQSTCKRSTASVGGSLSTARPNPVLRHLPTSRLLYAAEALYWRSRNLLRKVERPAITEEKQHWARTSIRKRGLNRRWTNILGNTDQTQAHGK